MAVIKVKSWGKDQGTFVIIEEENFDPKFHKIFTPKKPVKTVKKTVKMDE